jgi:hypothetical protein
MADAKTDSIASSSSKALLCAFTLRTEANATCAVIEVLYTCALRLLPFGFVLLFKLRLTFEYLFGFLGAGQAVW